MHVSNVSNRQLTVNKSGRMRWEDTWHEC